MMADDPGLFDDLIPAKAQPAQQYEPQSAATPAQQAYVAANGQGSTDPNVAAGSPQRPVYDTPTLKAGDDLTHVTTSGQLIVPGVDAEHNLFADIPSVTRGYNKAYKDLSASDDPGVEGMSDAVLNGLTLNNADRVKGALAVPGAAIRYLMGDHSVSPADAYAAERDLTRSEQADFEAKHPGLNFAGNVIGAAPIAEAAGGLMAGASPLETLGRGIGVSALTASGYGAGADKADPVRGAALGLGEGAALGAAAPVVGTIGRGIANTGRAIVNQVGDVLTPAGSPAAAAKAQAIAERYIAGKLGETTPADIAANPAAARGATVAEAMGPDAVADAASIVRRPGATAKAALTQVGPKSDRALGRTDRLLGDLTQATGYNPTTAESAVNDIVANGRAAAGPHYDAMEADTNRYMTPTMRGVLQTPAGKSALALTHRDLLNAAPKTGVVPADMGIVTTPDGQLTVPGGLRPVAVDMVKRNLDALVDMPTIAGGENATNANKGFDSARDAFVSSARQVVPNYDNALQTAADYKKVQSAYNDSKGLLFGPTSPTEAAAMMERVGTAHEKQAILARGASDLMARANAGTLTPESLQKPGLAQKLDLFYGAGTADQIRQAANLEGSLSATGARMTPNSGSITSDVAAHSDETDKAIDNLRLAGHIGKSLAEGRWDKALTAGVSHGFGAMAAASKAPQAQAVRDAIGAQYLSPARDFSGFTPPAPAATSALTRYLAAPRPVASILAPTYTGPRDQQAR